MGEEEELENVLASSFPSSCCFPPLTRCKNINSFLWSLLDLLFPSSSISSPSPSSYSSSVSVSVNKGINWRNQLAMSWIIQHLIRFNTDNNLLPLPPSTTTADAKNKTNKKNKENKKNKKNKDVARLSLSHSGAGRLHCSLSPFSLGLVSHWFLVGLSGAGVRLEGKYRRALRERKRK